MHRTGSVATAATLVWRLILQCISFYIFRTVMKTTLICFLNKKTSPVTQPFRWGSNTEHGSIKTHNSVLSVLKNTQGTNLTPLPPKKTTFIVITVTNKIQEYPPYLGVLVSQYGSDYPCNGCYISLQIKGLCCYLSNLLFFLLLEGNILYDFKFCSRGAESTRQKESKF